MSKNSKSQSQENYINEDKDRLLEELDLTSNTERNSIVTNTTDNTVEETVDWKEEAKKGNFMPASLKLERNEIHPDDVVDPITENRLIHLAVSYGFVNVTRCLVEKFNSSLNIKNKYGHTPMHIICSSQFPDLFLFCYLLNQNDSINTDVMDNTGVTPVFYASYSHFNIAFLLLAHLGADLNQLDIFGNSILYLTLTSGNKFALKMLAQHMKRFDINSTYYKGESSLSDILIASKNTRCCKHLCKYMHSLIHLSSLNACDKPKEKFSSYNEFNYEILQTLYFYKRGELFKFLKQVITNYNYKLYTLKLFFYDLVITNTKRLYKLIFILAFCLWLMIYCVTNFIFVFYSKYYSFSFSPFSLTTYIMIGNFISILVLIVSLFKIIFSKTFYFFQYSLSNPIHRSENVCAKLVEAIESDPLTIFFEDEICEVCLIKQDRLTNHCNICNKCVKNFHFHSKILNVCFDKNNIKSYVQFLSAVFTLLNFFIFLRFYRISIDVLGDNYYLFFPKENGFFANFLKFVYYENPFTTIIIFLFLIVSILLTCRLISIVICIGFNESYYNAFRTHKRISGEMQKRGESFHSIPKMNTVALKDFYSNYTT